MSDSSKEVNRMLHNLRGEGFRRAQNKIGSRTHILSASSHFDRSPSLPAGIKDKWSSSLSDADESTSSGYPGRVASTQPRTNSTNYITAGPVAPKSWVKSPHVEEDRTSPRWRREALEWAFARLPPVASNLGADRMPSLAILCMHRLVQTWPTEDLIEFCIPYIPTHLHRPYIRHRAIHDPLRISVLQGFGHPEGELLVVGPQASLTTRLLKLSGDDISSSAASGSTSAVTDSWDSSLDLTSSSSPQTALQTLIVLSSALSFQRFISFPPTITCLSLIDLPAPVPVLKLPILCPLLTVLDLSYNTWLADAGASLEKIQWSRWKSLVYLGLRRCAVSEQLVSNINKGRWDDVEITL